MGKKNSFAPDPPKKALCPFFLYRMDLYDTIKEQHPDLKMCEITRLIGEMWKNVDPALKERYEAKYEENKRKVFKERQ